MRIYPNGATTRRKIKLQVDPAVTSFTIPLRAQVLLPEKVTALAPSGLPEEVLREIASERTLTTKSKLVSGGLYRNYLLLFFHQGATLESKQAAVDLVGGDVAGGMPFEPEGWYVVRLSEVTSDSTLFDAIAELRALPQIRFAAPRLDAGNVLLDRIGTRGTRVPARLGG